MSPRRELLAFAATLAAIVAGFFHDALFGGKVLSPADVLFASAGFRDDRHGPDYEPANRLLMDPVLQFQPWLEFNRRALRAGRLPLWNPLAGCGAPHLANAQSAVFDPFHAIAYLGPLPDALAWMAAARLWAAGIGMFLLARRWGHGPWGRWFCGLAFPFSGFLIVWLLYPVTNVAIWMPWLFWAGDRVLARPERRSIAVLGLFAALVLVGGHIQTSAHVLLAAGGYAVWRTVRAARASRPASVARRLELEPVPAGGHAQGGHAAGQEVRPDPGHESAARHVDDRMARQSVGASTGPTTHADVFERPARRAWARPFAAWVVGIGLGILIAAVEVVPLAFYLARSPVWQDRIREVKSPATLRRPRFLASVCTAVPYLFGSQRRGHPHLGRPLGVSNLNESAGGFAGLATLLWLAPLAWSLRSKNPRIGFLAALGAAGALGAFRIPPVDNILRALPVVGVTDNRRLVLWVAFALVLLGGFGLDQVSSRSRRPPVWLWVAAALVLLAAAAGVGRFEGRLRARAVVHYGESTAPELSADAALRRARAEHQVRLTLGFVPRYYAVVGVHLLALAALAEGLRRARIPAPVARSCLAALTLADLLGFGYGLNPAIARGDDRPEPALITYLRNEVPPPARILGLGAELPPNVLMRYGLADARNYDSVELARSLDWFAPLYDPRAAARTSRRTITWPRVVAARQRLGEACVAAVVVAEPPPAGAFPRVDRVGRVWVARLETVPWAALDDPAGRVSVARTDAVFRIACDSRRANSLILRETYDPGWRAEIDGRPAAVEPHRAAFLSVRLPAGRHSVVLRYDPWEFRLAAVASALGLASVVFGLTLPPRFRSTRIIADGLGRTQARELESALCSSPAYH